jgi:hypothetical protein
MDQPISTSTTIVSKTDISNDCSSIPFAFKLVFGAVGYYTEKRLYTFLFLLWIALTAFAYCVEAIQIAPKIDKQSSINRFFRVGTVDVRRDDDVWHVVCCVFRSFW